MTESSRILVIGAGPMGQAHVKAFAALCPGNVAVYAPSTKNQAQAEALGVPFYSGDLETAIRNHKSSVCVIASPVEKLLATTQTVLNAGVKNVLLEKPGFLHSAQGHEMQALLAKFPDVYLRLAYNRRFFSSFNTALELMKANNEKLQAVFFEFTEWSHVIRDQAFQPEVKRHWALANSMHVIDTAFWPTGLPEMNKSVFVKSNEPKIDWHPSASTMTGAGLTEQQIPFSYLAAWAGPGRWALEWLTNQRRYIFKPMEQLKIQMLGSVKIEDHVIEDKVEVDFKPGVYRQAEAFLKNPTDKRLVTFDYALRLSKLADAIAGYRES